MKTRTVCALGAILLLITALRLITMERRGQFTDVPRLSDLARAVRR